MNPDPLRAPGTDAPDLTDHATRAVGWWLLAFAVVAVAALVAWRIAK